MRARRAGAGSGRFGSARPAVGVSIVVALAAACSTGETVETVETDETVEQAPAASLAASQVTASTVPRPAIPPPCTADEVAVWTAQARANGDAVDGVLRVANVGDRWCEVDISASPRLDPNIEPDVWLEPGEWAELVVGPTGRECDRPEVVTLAQLAVGEEAVDAPTTAIVHCGWALTAFFPLDPPAAGCTDLAAAVSGDWLVVTNESSVTCRLGELTGAGELGVRPRRPDEPMVTALAPGDLAGYALRPADDCTSGVVRLEFTGGASVDVAIGPCGLVELGAARPVLAGTAGLLGQVDRGAPVDVADIVARLAPFTTP